MVRKSGKLRALRSQVAITSKPHGNKHRDFHRDQDKGNSRMTRATSQSKIKEGHQKRKRTNE
eukprot:738341-Hanusia_phi.AAC.1